MLDDSKKPGRRKAFTSFEDIFKGTFDDNDVGGDVDDSDSEEVEEVQLPSGEMQSRYLGNHFYKILVFPHIPNSVIRN